MKYKDSKLLKLAVRGIADRFSRRSPQSARRHRRRCARMLEREIKPGVQAWLEIIGSAWSEEDVGQALDDIFELQLWPALLHGTESQHDLYTLLRTLVGWFVEKRKPSQVFADERRKDGHIHKTEREYAVLKTQGWLASDPQAGVVFKDIEPRLRLLLRVNFPEMSKQVEDVLIERQRGELSQGQIAELHGMSPSALSNLVKRWVEKGCDLCGIPLPPEGEEGGCGKAEEQKTAERAKAGLSAGAVAGQAQVGPVEEEEDTSPQWAVGR